MDLAFLPAHPPLARSAPASLRFLPQPRPHLHQPWDLCPCSSCGLVLCSLTYLHDSLDSLPSFRSMFTPHLPRKAFPARLWEMASSPHTPVCPCLSQAGFVSLAPYFVTHRLFCLLVPFVTYFTYWSWSSTEQGFCLICLLP